MTLWERLKRWWLERLSCCPECKLLFCEADDVGCNRDCDWLKVHREKRDE